MSLKAYLRHALGKQSTAEFPHANDLAHASEARQIVTEFYQTVLHRMPLENEVEQWLQKLRSGLTTAGLWWGIYRSTEATSRRGGLQTEYESPLEFVIAAYVRVLLRPPMPDELSFWLREMRTGLVRPENVLVHLFRLAENEARYAQSARGTFIKPKILGTAADLDWSLAILNARNTPSVEAEKPVGKARNFGQKRVRVSIICSLYKGADYIDRYMQNVTSQTVFDEYCELIIVDANSPENEYAIIKEYLDKFPQINYQRLPYRATIYEAWNIAIEKARGEYITNANLDDLRRVGFRRDANVGSGYRVAGSRCCLPGILLYVRPRPDIRRDRAHRNHQHAPSGHSREHHQAQFPSQRPDVAKIAA